MEHADVPHTSLPIPPALALHAALVALLALVLLYALSATPTAKCLELLAFPPVLLVSSIMDLDRALLVPVVAVLAHLWQTVQHVPLVTHCQDRPARQTPMVPATPPVDVLLIPIAPPTRPALFKIATSSALHC